MIANLLRQCLWLLVPMGLVGCVHPPQATEPVHLTILHTNDHHGRYWRSQDGEYGLAARRTLVEAVRSEVKAMGGHVLLLDAGDVNTGVPESDLQGAEPDFRGMSLLGYDAMAVGNHEFDRQPSTQRRQRHEWSRFPWLSANIVKDQQPVFEPYRVFTLGSLRVAVLGLTTEDAGQMGVASRYPGIAFHSATQVAGSMVPELRKQADVVVALTHLGHYVDGQHGLSAPGDVELARAVTGLDVVVGGHTHSIVCMLQENVRQEAYQPTGPCAPDRQNGAWIIQAGDRGRFVGRADFEWKHGQFALLRYTLIPVNLKGMARIAEDQQTLQLLEPYQSKISSDLKQPLGNIEGRFDGERSDVRHRRTNLGMLLAQVMQQSAEADFAVISSGGIRASLPEGPVTTRDLLTVLPFGNRLVVVTLTGDEVLAYVAAMAQKSPGSGAFAQYSGISFGYAGDIVSNVMIAGQPLQPERRYRLALPSFVAHGGDAYPDLSKHSSYHDTGLVDVTLLKDFVMARGTVHARDFRPPPSATPIQRASSP